jgi:Ni/Fe-hydrogenase 1 B-type cytochrome subunit
LRKEAAVDQRKRVYAWEFPVRFTHWINVLAILTLAATGIYIGSPFIHAVSAKQYIMGTVRTVHFIAGYTLLMSLIIRIYWAFMGNKYASWKVFLPFTAKRFPNVIDAIKCYSFISKKPPYAVGHTALAGITYFFVFLLFAFMIVSGFAMYSVTSQGKIAASVGGWLLGLMGLQSIRLYHHIGMYVILFFLLIHLYVAWWMDTVERNGVMGSIFGGYKFVTGKEWE